jgi:hypothetical protein
MIMSRWMRNAVVPLALAGMLGATVAAASASSASPLGAQGPRTAAGGHSAAVAKEAAARAALKGLRIGAPHQSGGAEAAFGVKNGIPTGTAGNWSGYVDTNHTSNGDFRNIAATWHVPEIVGGGCSSGTFATGYGLASFWIGLDGDGSGTVEQAGTLSECFEGSMYYWDWYEMYPEDSVIVNAVNPGDQISAYVDYTGEYWLLSLVDNTTASGFAELESCPSGSTCDNYSAEAIAEAPGGCVPSSTQTCRGDLYLMPDFDYVNFYGISDATFNRGGSLASSPFGPANLTMVDSADHVLAKVSSLWSKDGFVDRWEASS